MVGELHVCVGDGRTPPALEGLDVDDGEWVLSLEPHRDLLVDITGIESMDDLTLRDLETMRARLEGYVEREKRSADRTAERRSTRTRASAGPFRWFLTLLVGVIPLVGSGRTRESDERRAHPQRSYSVERVRRLAHVFRLATEFQRREITATNAPATAGAAAD